MLRLPKPGIEFKEATGSQGNFLRDPSCTCGSKSSGKPSLALFYFVCTTPSETRSKGDENKVGIIQITKKTNLPTEVINLQICNLVIVDVIATNVAGGRLFSRTSEKS